MAVIRLDAFHEDTIVVHFGGSAGSIDAYTLANALTGFADTAYAVNATIDPGHDIEIVIEATGPGSYRTVIRRVKKHYKGVLSGIAATIFWNVVSNAIYDAALKGADPKPQITINSNEVVIKHGNDTIIVREASTTLPRMQRRIPPYRKVSRRRSKHWRRTLVLLTSASAQVLPTGSH